MQRSTIAATLLLSFFCIPSSAGAGQSSTPAPVKADANGYVGNEACARCHASIFQSYQGTAMAHASGPALDNLLAGDFLHKKSGVSYRIYSEKLRARG